MAVEFLLGATGALCVWFLTPALLTSLHVSPEQHASANYALRALALALPIDFLTAACRGTLQARQRLDLDNAATLLSNVGTYCVYLLMLLTGNELHFLVNGLLALKLLVLVMYWRLSRVALPSLSLLGMATIDNHFRPRVREMMVFGGWISLNGMMGPLLLYFDRWVISYQLGVSAVIFYTIPFQLLSKAYIITASVIPTLLPAFSSLDANGERSRIERYFCSAHRYVALLLIPVMAALYLWSPLILKAWLGDEFPARATASMRVLVWGFAIALFAPLSGALFTALGRPYFLTALYAVELPLNFIAVMVLTTYWGLEGAAASFALRALLETLGLWVLVYAATLVGQREWAITLGRLLLVGGLTGASTAWISTRFTDLAPLSLAAVSVLIIGASVVLTAAVVLDVSDRAFLRRLVCSRAYFTT